MTGRAPPPDGPAISVLVPCYNSASTVVDSIRSLMNQTEKPAEIVVVDDGSTDGTAETVEDLCERDPAARELVRFHRLEKNLGPGGARNRAAGIARGDVLFFAESDGAYPRNTIRKVRAFFRTGEERIYLGPAYRRCTPGAAGWTVFWNALFEARHWLVIHDRWPLHSGWVFSKRVFLEEGGYDEKCVLGSDVEMIERLRLAGLERKIMKRSTYFHREPQSVRALCRRFYRAGALTKKARQKRGTLGRDAGAALALVVVALLPAVNLLVVPVLALAPADSRIGWRRMIVHKRRKRTTLVQCVLFPYRYYLMKLAVSIGVLRSLLRS